MLNQQIQGSKVKPANTTQSPIWQKLQGILRRSLQKPLATGRGRTAAVYRNPGSFHTLPGGNTSLIPRGIAAILKANTSRALQRQPTLSDPARAPHGFIHTPHTPVLQAPEPPTAPAEPVSHVHLHSSPSPSPSPPTHRLIYPHTHLQKGMGTGPGPR